MSEGTIWERLRWWLTWRIWRPARGQCSWCGNLTDAVDLVYGTNLGWGAWSCASCTEYPEG